MQGGSRLFQSDQPAAMEVALRAYADLGRALAAGDDKDEESPVAKLQRIGVAYVGCALSNPGHFSLMFRSDLVDRSDARYQTVSAAALMGMGTAAQALASARPGPSHPTADAHQASGRTAPDGRLVRGQIFSIWSTLHGMAHLVLENKAGYLVDGSDPVDFVDNHLPALLAQLWPAAGDASGR